MLKNRFFGLGLLAVVSACAWACGSDGDNGAAPAAGGSSAGGTSGSGGAGGGKSGGAGTAGNSAGTSGTAGTAGSSAGTSGTAGSSGGTSGSGGSSGSAGTAGSSGGTSGSGGSGGGEAGTGGEAGSTSTDPLTADCTKMCDDMAAANLGCMFDGGCLNDCLAKGGATDAPNEYLDMVACYATKLTPADYVCSDMMPIVWPAAAANGPCETETCTWICTDMTFIGDSNVYGRCCS
ncbi:MAG TPA: hypothetical protein VGI10_21145 [Polyangiaceae bacterium]